MIRVATVARVEDRLDTIQLLERARVVRVSMAGLAHLMVVQVAVVVVLRLSVELGHYLMALPEEPDSALQLPVLLSPTRAVAVVGLEMVPVVQAALVVVVRARTPRGYPRPQMLTRVVVVVELQGGMDHFTPAATAALVS